MLLKLKEATINAVGYNEFCDPLSCVGPALGCNLGHFGNFAKINLNPLSFVVTTGYPGDTQVKSAVARSIS